MAGKSNAKHDVYSTWFNYIMWNKSVHDNRKLWFIIAIHYHAHMGVGKVDEEEEEELEEEEQSTLLTPPSHHIISYGGVLEDHGESEMILWGGGREETGGGPMFDAWFLTWGSLDLRIVSLKNPQLLPSVCFRQVRAGGGSVRMVTF